MPDSIGACGHDGLPLVVVDDLPVPRAALSLLLASHPGLEVVAEVGSAQDAVEAVREGAAAGRRVLVLVPLRLPGPRDALWLTRALAAERADATVLLVAEREDPSSVARAMADGSGGVLDARLDPARFLRLVVDAASDGGLVLEGLSGRGLAEVSAWMQRHEEAPITERQREVLVLAAEGLTAAQIGRRLGVGERTVTTHLHRAYRRLGATGRMTAVAAAARAGLLPHRPLSA